MIRPWVVRRACLERVGLLDEAFRPTEWDEADLACRIREAGWKVATCGYERLGGYYHLGSTTIGTPSQAYLDRVLKNGRLFHERWDATIARAASAAAPHLDAAGHSRRAGPRPSARSPAPRSAPWLRPRS